MRTDEEILARIEEREPFDWLGFERNDLIIRLPFEKAKPFLKPEVTAEAWTPAPRDRESVLAEMRDYMRFAWEKANEGRGLSAGRTMHHYMAWIWLIGDDLGELSRYQYYGKDNLLTICKHYGFESHDDGERTNG